MVELRMEFDAEILVDTAGQKGQQGKRGKEQDCNAFHILSSIK